MAASLRIARSWMQQWDAESSREVLEKYPEELFFSRQEDRSYVPADTFHFDNLMLGGQFPAAEDPLGGLDAENFAIMDVLDPDAEIVSNVHMVSQGVSQILIDINIMTQAEAHYLQGSHGIERVIQSNIGGPDKEMCELCDIAQDWITGETPGCNCLICNRVPGVLHKLRGHSDLTPLDVLPLTTIPRLAKVVDEWLQPQIKIALGSQGFLGPGAGYQPYPSAAVGFMKYPEVTHDGEPHGPRLSVELDPKRIFEKNRAPEGYRYVHGFFWENGKDVFRKEDDPDQHVFGFVFVKEEAPLSEEEIRQEMFRFQPRRSLEYAPSLESEESPCQKLAEQCLSLDSFEGRKACAQAGA